MTSKTIVVQFLINSLQIWCVLYLGHSSCDTFYGTGTAVSVQQQLLPSEGGGLINRSTYSIPLRGKNGVREKTENASR